MVAALRERLTHDDEQERLVVMEELRKIAALRLAKAVVGMTAAVITRLSTHVLDTSLGRPAGANSGRAGTRWARWVLGGGRPRNDRPGRPDPAAQRQSRWNPGEYRLVLVTGGYFQEHHDAVFYPTIAVQFMLSGDREHYHIAVLTSTYSYTTYLGSC